MPLRQHHHDDISCQARGSGVLDSVKSLNRAPVFQPGTGRQHRVCHGVTRTWRGGSPRCRCSNQRNRARPGRHLRASQRANCLFAHGGSGFEVLERNTTQVDTGVSIRDVVMSAIIKYHTLLSRPQASASKTGGSGQESDAYTAIDAGPHGVLNRHRQPRTDGAHLHRGCRRHRRGLEVSTDLKCTVRCPDAVGVRDDTRSEC